MYTYIQMKHTRVQIEEMSTYIRNLHIYTEVYSIHVYNVQIEDASTYTQNVHIYTVVA